MGHAGKSVTTNGTIVHNVEAQALDTGNGASAHHIETESLINDIH